jgi:hypothetical protein
MCLRDQPHPPIGLLLLWFCCCIMLGGVQPLHCKSKAPRLNPRLRRSCCKLFRPETPDTPNKSKKNPPTSAPMVPSAMSSQRPCPWRLTIWLPMNPAISPRMIQDTHFLYSFKRGDAANTAIRHRRPSQPVPLVRLRGAAAPAPSAITSSLCGLGRTRPPPSAFSPRCIRSCLAWFGRRLA